MAKGRIQVNDLSTVGLRPAAAPVDTFVQPTKGRGLAALAQGLSALQPSLAKFTEVYADKVDTQQQQSGIDEARKFAETGKTYADAVKQGKIPRSANPFFVAGFREQFGRVSADRWHEDLIAAMGADETLKSSTNMQDFDTFAEKHRAEWMQANVGDNNRDRFFEQGFGNRADVRLTQEREQFAREIGSRIEKQSDEAHFAEVQKSVLESIGKVDPTEIAKGIDNLNSALLLQGRNGRQTNLTTIRAISSAAVQLAQQGDPHAVEALELLQKVKGGTGSLGNTSYGADAYSQTRDKVNEEMDRSHRVARQQSDEEREDRTRSTLGQAVKALVQNPNADMTPFLSQLGDVPDAAGLLQSAHANVTSLKYKTNQDVKTNLFSRIWTSSDVTERTIVTAMNGKALTAQDADWLIGQLEQKRQDEKRQAGGQSVFDDFNFKGTLQNLKQRFADPITGMVAGETADRVDHAEAMLRSSWLIYMDGEGKTADPLARNAWLEKEASAIVKQQRGADAMGSEANSPSPDLSGSIQTTWKKEAVITTDDLAKLRTEIGSGSLSAETRSLLQRNGITSPEMFGQFLRTQLQFLGTPSTDTSSKK